MLQGPEKEFRRLVAVMQLANGWRMGMPGHSEVFGNGPYTNGLLAA
jgi:hypothetical protein